MRYLSKLSLIWVLASLSFFSCHEQQQSLGIRKMADILTDMHYAESLSTLYLPKDSLRKFVNRNKDSLQLYYGLIFKKHQTNEKEFMMNYKSYIKNPVQMDSIYFYVVNNINLERAKSPVE